MEHEFNNRISAQRRLLQVINKKPWQEEDLFGLSYKAIERWIAANRLDPKLPIVGMVKEVSNKLFFLANKSQDQISEQYKMVRSQIVAACDEIRCELERSR